MVLLIGLSFPLPGEQAVARTPQQTPSLTAPLLADASISCCVLDAAAADNWSAGHLFAAAKLLRSRGGRLILYGTDTAPSPLFDTASDEQALRVLLGRQEPPVSDARSAAPERRRERLRADSVPILGVAGAQSRIGCTTQAVGLWHWLRSAGCEPAIVCTREQRELLAGSMRCRQIEGGCRVEGVPFVSRTDLFYDSYILDLGTGGLQAARQADLLVLVAGVKAWELPYTAAALRTAANAAVLLSFCSDADAASLAPLFGGRQAYPVPWMPELWQPCEAAMEVYERAVRPALEPIPEPITE